MLLLVWRYSLVAQGLAQRFGDGVLNRFIFQTFCAQFTRIAFLRENGKAFRMESRLLRCQRLRFVQLRNQWCDRYCRREKIDYTIALSVTRKTWRAYSNPFHRFHRGSPVSRRIVLFAECKRDHVRSTNCPTGNTSTLFRHLDLDNRRCRRTIDSTTPSIPSPQHNSVASDSFAHQSIRESGHNRRTICTDSVCDCRIP